MLIVYCADIGSVRHGNFGWARLDRSGEVEEHRGSAEIAELVDAVIGDLADARNVALGFECPLYVPVPAEPLALGAARVGEGNHSWSAGAGSGVLAIGIVQVCWILAEVRRRAPVEAHMDWPSFVERGGLFVWEASVTATAKALTHIDDAGRAVAAFSAALPDPTAANAVSAPRPFSLLGAALVWSGWSDDVALLHAPCLVIRAAPVATVADELGPPVAQ